MSNKSSKGVLGSAEQMAKGISQLSKGETPMFPQKDTRKNKVKKE